MTLSMITLKRVLSKSFDNITDPDELFFYIAQSYARESKKYLDGTW